MTPDPIQVVGLEQVRKHRGWFLLLGIVLILVGSTAIGDAVILTAFSMKFLGWLMVVAGIAGILHAFSFGRGWGGFFIDLITGILYSVAGFMMLANLAASAKALTLLIAMVLIFEGLFRAITAIIARYPHWGWMLLSGAVTTFLGVFISLQWPYSGLWVIGLYVGISMILNGWSLVMLSLAVKRLPAKAAGEPPGEQPAAA